MSWREEIKPASYKGVPFEWEDLTRSGGKRGTSHEFIGRRDPYFEPMGLRTGEFPIIGFVLGDDYLDKKNALIAALESDGPGELVHPTYGVLEVECPSFHVNESMQEGMGKAKITMTFIRVGDLPQPSATVPKKLFLQGVVDGVRSAVNAVLSRTFNVVGFPSYVVDEALATATAITDEIDKVTNSIRAQTQNVAVFKSNINKLQGKLTEIISAPATIAAEYSTLYAAISGIFDDKKGTAGKLLLLAPGVPAPAAVPSASVNSPGDVQRVINENELNQFHRRHAVLAAAEAMITAVFDDITTDSSDGLITGGFRSIEDVIAFKAQLVEQTEAILNTDDLDQDLYEQFYKLQTEIIRAIPNDIDRLPSKFDFELKQSTPSLAVAFDLFGDIDKEAEIREINAIANPLFMPGGVTYEAIGDV